MYQIQYNEDIVFYGADRARLRLDLFVPQGKEDYTTVVFFYGGGFIGGRKEDLTAFAEQLAAAGYGVALPNYRYYPEYPYPTAMEDGAAAVSWVLRNIGSYHGSSQKVYVGGHSAGSYLAMLLAFNKSFLCPYDVDPDKDIAGWILASGQPTTHYHYLETEGKDPRMILVDERAPIYHVHKNGSRLMILGSDHDIPGRLSQNMLLIETLKTFKYTGEIVSRVLVGHDHSSYMNPSEDGIPIVSEIIDFIGE